MALLEITDLQKNYRDPEGSLHRVVDVPAFTLNDREQVALRGESGSGKTTLLHLIAGILKADHGTIRIAGREMTGLSEAGRDQLRAQAIGYIFQTFNLLQGCTCLENVLLGMKFGPGIDRPFAEELLQRVGLSDKLRHLPRQLSVGQQQRVAVARALAGNLDHVNAAASLKLIREACRENGAALLLVSHDREVLGGFERVLDLQTLNRATAPVEATS
jgi:ABC-type lipoprotein export system ATPase subunit